MLEHEGDILRAEVHAFRSVACWLSDPTAGLLDDLVQIEERLNLISTLPLVDVDLFAAVPDMERHGMPPPASGEVRVRQGGAMALPLLPHSAHTVTHQEAPRPAATPAGSEVPQQAPVFSFRHEGRRSDLLQGATWPPAAQRRGHGQPSPSDMPSQGRNSPAHAPIQPSAGREEARGDPSVYAEPLRPALTQLAQVAEEVAQQRQRAADISSDTRSVAATPEPVRTPEPGGLSQLERLVRQVRRLTSHGHGARLSREKPTGRDGHDTQPGPWVSRQAQDRPPTDPEAPANDTMTQYHALHLINSHVDHLLSPDMAAHLTRAVATALSAPAEALGTEDNAGHPSGHTGHTRVALAETAAGIVGAAPQTPAGEFWLPEHAGAPQVDAARLAALVNEVLIEQARRHGVDLS
jgi:hypothetical protein